MFNRCQDSGFLIVKKPEVRLINEGEAFDKEDSKALVEYIFGPENNSNDSHRTGAYSFFEAQLLSRPVRSNVKAWFNATSPAVIGDFLENLENFDIAFDDELKTGLEKLMQLVPEQGKPIIFENITNAILEDMETTVNDLDTSELNQFLGKAKD